MDDIKEYIEENIINTDRENAIKRYKEKHCHCPACGSGSFTQTLKPMRIDESESKPIKVQDYNDVCCNDCGWQGQVNDLIGEDK